MTFKNDFQSAKNSEIFSKLILMTGKDDINVVVNLPNIRTCAISVKPFLARPTEEFSNTKVSFFSTEKKVKIINVDTGNVICYLLLHNLKPVKNRTASEEFPHQ